MQRNISLCLIVKNDKEEVAKSLEAIHSIEDQVNEVVIDLNGGGEIPASLQKYNVKSTKWENDFAKARNNNFARATGDWIIWMDADDVFSGGEKLKELVDNAEAAGKSGIFLPYHYQIDSKGNPIEMHWKLQVMKNDEHGHWQGRIHEDFLPDRAVKYAKVQEIKRVHLHGQDNHTEKTERNLKILLEDLKEQGGNPDPRTLMYAAKTYIMAGEKDIAETMLLKYLELSGWEDEIYDAHLLLAEIHHDNPDMAIQHCLNASMVKPELPDAYFAIANVYIEQKTWSKALTYLETGMTKDVNMDRNSVFWADITWKPLAQYAYVLMNIGKLSEAQNYAQRAVNMGGDALDLLDLIEANLDNKETALAVMQIAKRLEADGEEDKIPQLISAVPNAVKDNPYVLSVQFKYLPAKTWGEDEIVYYCPRSVEPWSPKSLEEGGIGGSETAVINLAKEWAKKGYKVTVYNWCSTDEGEYDGVNYVNYWNFNWQDSFNILISWRYPEMFDLDVKAKFKCVDVHDVMSPADFPSTRLENIDKVFVKTRAHADCFPNIPEEKFAFANNGLDLERFKQDPPKKRGKVIYSSTPNRGLDILLDVWPNIKKEVPDAELHVFYGFKTFYELEKGNPERMNWMKGIEDKVQSTEGVIWHDRVDQDTLAKHFQESEVWAYPTYFYEISCITAMEAMAANAFPVTIDYGALKETINGNGVVIEGDIHIPEVKEEFEKSVVSALKYPSTYNGLEYVKENLQWSQIAAKWIDTWTQK